MDMDIWILMNATPTGMAAILRHDSRIGFNADEPPRHGYRLDGRVGSLLVELPESTLLGYLALGRKQSRKSSKRGCVSHYPSSPAVSVFRLNLGRRNG